MQKFVSLDKHKITYWQNAFKLHHDWQGKSPSIIAATLALSTLGDVTPPGYYLARQKLEVKSLPPFTGQTLAVMLAGSLLTVRQAALSLGAFLVLGIVGLPIFAGGVGGLGIIAGPRGGYLIGFLAGAVVIALIKGKKTNVLRLGLANVIGYAMGVGLAKGFLIGALPYLPGDLIKVITAVAVSIKVNPHLNRQAQQ